MKHSRAKLNIGRSVAVLLLLTLILNCVPSVFAEGESGQCGDSLSWSFSGGTLTITGSGEMYNFPESTMAPWYAIRDQIVRLVLPEGLKSIGNLAFYDCAHLTAVDIPDSVLSVGEYAFANCERLALLDLGDGLNSVGAAAFYSCHGLSSVRFPESLTSIGPEAFYDCSELRSITIPAAVRSVGSAAFAYCTSLVRAELKNPVTILPDWTFFGCRQLSTVILPETLSTMGNAAFRDCQSLFYVSYGGQELSQEEIRETIAKDVPGFDGMGYVTDQIPNDTSASAAVTENPDGTIVVENAQVTEMENSTVSSSVELVVGEGMETVSSSITVTVENNAGWQEVTETVDRTLSDLHEQTSAGAAKETVVTVYVKDSQTLDQQFMDTVAGRDVTIQVVTEDGSSWKVDCEQMDIHRPSGSYDLRYSLQGASTEICKQMAVDQGYLLKFTAQASINAELVIQLPQELARQTATLFHQENRRTLVLHQSVMIDAEGRAHFYLGEVTNDVDYYIGINVPGTEAEVIIPQELQAEFGIDYAEPPQYVITGRASSWGIGVGTVTWILAAVMIGTIAAVGGVMYAVNKRRLKQGYVPDTTEE